MIRSRADLLEYLIADKKELGIDRRFPRPFTDEIWKYEISLRKYEYWINQRENIITKIFRIIYKLIVHQRSIRLGIFIGPNTCEKGLCIVHPNCIQINWHAHIGENLRIQEGVTIGAGRGGVPNIGNNVFLGSGCKVIGGYQNCRSMCCRGKCSSCSGYFRRGNNCCRSTSKKD